MNTIFHFSSYKAFLNDFFDKKDSRGKKAQLAEFLGCQPGFISQVLKGEKTDFSLEHVEKIANFLELNLEEKMYLIKLAQLEKAGSIDLKKIFETEIKEIQKSYREVGKKIEKRGKNLSMAEKSIYYSHWGYLAVHMIVSIDEFQTKDKIKKHFQFTDKFIDEIISFLLDTDLITLQDKKFKIGQTRIHLEPTSPFIKMLHQNLRQKALHSLSGSDNPTDLHYSSVLVMSKNDIEKIKDMILKFIKDKEKILLPSPNEDIVVLNIDYFKI